LSAAGDDRDVIADAESEEEKEDGDWLYIRSISGWNPRTVSHQEQHSST